MARPKIPKEEKRKHRHVTLSDFEAAELRNLSPRGELSDGIRIALAEANLLHSKRKIELTAKINNVRSRRT